MLYQLSYEAIIHVGSWSVGLVIDGVYSIWLPTLNRRKNENDPSEYYGFYVGFRYNGISHTTGAKRKQG